MTGKLLFLACVSVCAAYVIEKSHREKSWDHLVLAQFWPATSCYVYFGKEWCSGIPEGVTGWTIHGLWPSSNEKTQPACCNNTMKFQYDKIASLSSQLKTFWPSYNSSGDPDALWDHEWMKHGTCAVSLPAISGEFNYFNTTLHMQRPLNIEGILTKHGITPSATQKAKPQDFFDAIQKELGVKPMIACFYHEGNHYLEQVWLCYSKSLELQDCLPINSSRAVTRKCTGTKVLDSKSTSFFNDCPNPESPSVYFLPPSQTSIEQKEIVLRFHSEMEEAVQWP